MNGILLVKKEKHITSRDVINILNKEFNMKKIGHAGTLDPFAEGLLVVCFGKYTKLINEFINQDKTYVGNVVLGITTDTLDITGNIIDKSNNRFSEAELKRTFKTFTKTYKQEVPIYSAVKIDGKKLYEYARSQKEIKLPVRNVSIYNLELVHYNENEFSFKTHVSKGTYIRSLIRDITQSLDTVGVLNNLKRVNQGQFSIENAYSIEDIKNGNYEFLTVKEVFDYETIVVSEEDYKRVINGNFLTQNKKDGNYFVEYNNEVIGIYTFVKNVGKIKYLLINV